MAPEQEEELEEIEEEIEEVEREEDELEEQRETLIERFLNKLRRKKPSYDEYLEEEIEKELPEDIKEIIRILHSWIQKLPPKKLQEFKASPDFQVYKEVLEKHNLIRK